MSGFSAWFPIFNPYFCTLAKEVNMAVKKRKKKGQLSLSLGINDERIPKLIGILCLFFALYLFIAFTSYLFTWHIDQDKVMRFDWWRLLFESGLDMANWLGRLGAIVSNMFFFWGHALVFVATPHGYASLGSAGIEPWQTSSDEDVKVAA